MSSGGPGNRRKSPSWEKYERLDSSESEDELQNDVVGIPHKKAPLALLQKWKGLYQVTVLLILTFEGNGILNLKHDNKGHADKVRNTLIFNAFVFCQIFNEFNSRKPEKMNTLRGLCSSRSFIGILSFKFALQAFTLVLQVLIVEFAGKIASTTSLDWKKWIICIVIGFISWPLAAIAKFIPVPETPFVDYFSRRKASSEHRSFSDSIAEVNREQSHHIEIT